MIAKAVLPVRPEPVDWVVSAEYRIRAVLARLGPFCNGANALVIQVSPNRRIYIERHCPVAFFASRGGSGRITGPKLIPSSLRGGNWTPSRKYTQPSGAKPYVKTNKSDFIDAEAIAEAVSRPIMRFVPIKTEDQLDMQSLHRVRERWVMRRTAILNQIRGLLLERGITLRKGRRYVNTALPGIIEDAAAKLSGALRILLAQLKLELDQMAVRLDEADAVLNKTARENAACQRLLAIPGIGPVTSTALIAAIGNGAAFRRGREFAAWMGIVPREHSTGGKQKLLGISKRGNTYLRTLFIHGARAVLQQSTKQTSGLRAWLAQLSARTHPNIAVVALANELARIAWAVLAKNELYRPLVLIGPAAA